jgi:hypothetical protein
MQPGESSGTGLNMGGAMACPRPGLPHMELGQNGRGQAIAPPIFRWSFLPVSFHGCTNFGGIANKKTRAGKIWDWHPSVLCVTSSV